MSERHEKHWGGHEPTPSERRYIRSLEIQMEAVREKLKPHEDRLRELRAKRRVARNRSYQREAYRKRKS